MSSDFPRIISLLRREKRVSQKQVALDLGISQALLSHYEKGIRECGLDFVLKVADYYGVSCDYLLGRSADRNGLMISADEIPVPDLSQRERTTSAAGFFAVLYKKLLINSINILFDILGKMKCDRLTQEVASFLMISIYRMFRVIYSANSKNPTVMFSLGTHIYKGYSDASMNMAEANALAIVSGACGEIKSEEPIEEPIDIPLDSFKLEEEYPETSSSLLNVIKNAEDIILGVKSE